MDQVELLKMYAVRLAQRLGDNQKYLEFTASRDTGYGIETMFVEVKRYNQYARVVMPTKNYQKDIMLVYLCQLRKATILIL